MNRVTARIAVLCLLALLGVALLPFHAQAQGDNPPANPNANISWPPPVYVLRGQVEIRGTANLPNMTNYFISFRALNNDLTPVSNQYLPAVGLTAAPVTDGVLGIWDTTFSEDGLYEIQLTVNVRGATAVTHVVGPLRIENTPITIQPGTGVIQTPTPIVSQTPTGTVNQSSVNVRTGDSTAFSVLTVLRQGEQVTLIGLSSSGSNWYQVRISDGRLGWMAPSVLTVTGNVATLPLVTPPTPPPTPIPTIPPATPIPPLQGNLVGGVIVFDPSTPTCNQTFTVGFDVANLGTQPTSASGTVSLVDTRVADGTVQGTTIGGFPVLAPGQTFRVSMPLTISTWYNENHRITLTIDPNNAISETTEADNIRVIDYVLQKGSCP
jgi:uncharacterized protein YgiM (DUF1202 family)